MTNADHVVKLIRQNEALLDKNEIRRINDGNS
jgi:hypothetical protein